MLELTLKEDDIQLVEMLGSIVRIVWGEEWPWWGVSVFFDFIAWCWRSDDRRLKLFTKMPFYDLFILSWSLQNTVNCTFHRLHSCMCHCLIDAMSSPRTKRYYYICYAYIFTIYEYKYENSNGFHLIFVKFIS